MRKVVLMLVVMMLAATSIVAAQEQPAPAQPASQAEVSALRAEIAELRAVLTALQAAQPERTISIGVMPIENAGRIPQVGYSFRQVMVSALNEAGIRATESLDDETLRWVQRQDQLVRERWISPVSAPPRGELRGVDHYLLGVVTNYTEEDVEDVKILGGILVVRFGGGARIRTGSLVVDWRIVDAASGAVIDAFRTEATLRRREFAGAIRGAGGYRHERPLPEQAARETARQAAERIAALVQPAPPKPALPPAPTAAK